jgi:nucleoid-associated protein EbfC
MNINALMKQVQKVQADAAKAQSELEAAVVEGSAGGGAVTIRMTGAHKVESVQISQEVAEAGDREMLEDVVKAALEDVLDKVSALTKETMGKAMGGVNLPGMPKLF